MLPGIVIAGIMLAMASYFDIKYREVQDKFWIPFFIIGAVLTAYDYYIGTPGFALVPLALSIGLTSGIAWAAYFLHLYGGADAKAIMVLSLLFPVYQDVQSLHGFGAFMSFTNSILLTALLPAAFLLINLGKMSKGGKIFQGFEEESGFSKFKALFLGYRRKQAGKYDFSLEKIVDGKKRFHISLGKIDEDFTKGSDIWVTPGIPLLVFVLLGFIVTVVVGDLLFTFFLTLFEVFF